MPHANLEERRAYHRAYRAKNHVRLLARDTQWRADNREKHRAYAKQWKKDHPEGAKKLARRYTLNSKYKLTLGEWEALFTSQKECCAICHGPSGRKNGYWSTDHDHKTGKVRGILCNNCNTMLGLAKDDPNRLRGGAKYLEERGQLCPQ